MKKYDEYGIEQGTLNLTPYIVLGVVLFFVLIGIVIFIFNIGNLTKHFTNNEKNKQQEQTKQEIKVEKVEGLVVPEIDKKTIYKDSHYEIELSKIDTSSKGYTLYIDIKASQKIQPSQISINRIQIDGYDIDGSFKIDLNAGEIKSEKVILKKTDLEHLDINNFKELTFYISIFNGIETVNVLGNSNMKVFIPIDNEKKGLTSIYDKYNIYLNYYKKIEDNDYTYLYFEVENKSNYTYNININKMIINDKLYEDTYSIYSKPSGKQISYMKIPKSKVESVDKLKVSFFLERETTMDEYRIHISAEKEIKT